MPNRIAVLRSVLAFVALPGLVAYVAPLLLARTVPSGSFRAIALVPLAAGTALLVWCAREFHVAGQGTLAPWDPPRRLVASGPYRISRNPMYVAVVLVLAGWTIGFRSAALWLYTLAAFAAFHLRVVLGEEPWLARTHGKAWERHVARVPRWLFPSRRALMLTLAGLATALPLAGLVYEAYADARGARRFPPPGELVDVGGRRLHLICIGEGTPIVLFESSGWGSSLSYERVRDRLSTRSRVCSYDRMGMGWSDAGPGRATSTDLASELAVLQDRAKLPQPFVVVASSIGGLTAEMFARRYPERVAGLVFLDAATSDVFDDAESLLVPARLAACAAALAARFGAIRLLDPFGLSAEQNDDGGRGAAITYGARPWGTLCAIVGGLPESRRELATAPALPDVPLLVLSAGRDEGFFPRLDGLAARFRATRLAAHQAFAKRSKRGSWRLVPESAHLIGSSQPDAVADAITEVLDGLR